MKDFIRRVILVIFLLLSIISFSVLSLQRNKSEVWFRNVDQDGTLLIDTLRVNSGRSPDTLDHPSHGTFIIYGNILKFLDWVKIIPISRFDQLEKSDDPLMLLPEVFYKARGISIFLCIVSVLLFGAIFFVLTRRLIFLVLAVFLLLCSGGLFLQSLLVRSELPSVLFLLFAFLFISIDYKSKNTKLSPLYMFVSGLFLGLAVLSKVEAIPALLFVIVSSFLVFLKKKQPLSFIRSRSQIIYTIAIYLFTLKFSIGFFVSLKEGNYSTPLLFKVFLTSIILSGLPVLFPKFKKLDILAFLPKLSLLLTGFLASFYISFYALNFNSHSKSENKLFQAEIYERVFNVPRDVVAYGGKVRLGFSAIYKDFKRFLEYYSVISYYFVLIATLMILGLILTRKPPNSVSLITVLIGLTFCFAASLRYFQYHHLIYADIFFIGAIMFLIIQCHQFEYPKLSAKGRKIILPVFYLLLFLAVYLSFKKQNSTISYVYGNWSSYNRVDRVYCLDAQGNEFPDLMLSKYRSIDNVMRRVCTDPYLNGSNRGINLMEKPVAKSYCSQFFVDSAEQNKAAR